MGPEPGPDPNQQRSRPASRGVSLLLGDGRSTGASSIGGHGLCRAGSRRPPPAPHWLLRSISTDTGELARTPGVARRVILLSKAFLPNRSHCDSTGKSDSRSFLLPLFTEVRGIRILGSSR